MALSEQFSNERQPEADFRRRVLKQTVEVFRIFPLDFQLLCAFDPKNE